MTADEPLADAESLRSAGDQIERLLAELAALADPRPAAWAEELLRVVTSLYGEGLARVLALACGPEPLSGTALADALAGDGLVASLLLLHGLHPEGTRRRVERALAELGRLAGSGDVRLLAIDEESATVRVRLLAADGPAGAPALEELVRQVIGEAAPEIVAVEVERPLLATPVNLGRRRGGNRAPTGAAGRPARAGTVDAVR